VPTVCVFEYGTAIAKVRLTMLTEPAATNFSLLLTKYVKNVVIDMRRTNTLPIPQKGIAAMAVMRFE
jgi:hypothetical protein